jgi:hypothetical protein
LLLLLLRCAAAELAAIMSTAITIALPSGRALLLGLRLLLRHGRLARRLLPGRSHLLLRCRLRTAILDERRRTPISAVAPAILMAILIILRGRDSRHADHYGGGNEQIDTSPVHLGSLLTIREILLS